jgi:hypothetical protein
MKKLAAKFDTVSLRIDSSTAYNRKLRKFLKRGLVLART